MLFLKLNLQYNIRTTLFKDFWKLKMYFSDKSV